MCEMYQVYVPINSLQLPEIGKNGKNVSRQTLLVLTVVGATVYLSRKRRAHLLRKLNTNQTFH